MEFLDYEYTPSITKMDGELDGDGIRGDFICITNVETEKILEWLNSYSGEERGFSIDYPEVFIFDHRETLDRFVHSLERSSEVLEEDFLAHDIKMSLASSKNNIRIIRSYKFKEIQGDIGGMCEFVDEKSFEETKDDISYERLVIKIHGLDYEYRQVFYCI